MPASIEGFRIGDRVRFIDPRPDAMHMLNWEGEIIEARPGSSTVRVRLQDPNNPRRYHTEGYYPYRLQFIGDASALPGLSPVEYVIHKLQKRQKFYQEHKSQLPTWYAAYGD